MALGEYLVQSGELQADYRYSAALDGKTLREGQVTGDNLDEPIDVVFALAGLLGESQAVAAANPLAPRRAMFAPRAKRVIFLFMHGGPSQVDTFDPKPLLARDNGKPYSGRRPRVSAGRTRRTPSMRLGLMAKS